MRKPISILAAIFMLLILSCLLFLSGCFESQPQSSLIISNNNNLLEDVKIDRIIKDEHIFKEYLNKTALPRISYLAFGDVINLEFQGEAPDFIYVTDSIIDANGKYLFDKSSDMKIEYTKESDNSYSWVVAEHFANFRIPEVESEKRIYRGIKIDAFFGEQKTSYILVIQTDNKNKTQ